MKILRFYWSHDRQKMMNDQVLCVVRETKTQLIAIDRRNPRCEYSACTTCGLPMAVINPYYKEAGQCVSTARNQTKQ